MLCLLPLGAKSKYLLSDFESMNQISSVMKYCEANINL